MRSGPVAWATPARPGSSAIAKSAKARRLRKGKRLKVKGKSGGGGGKRPCPLGVGMFTAPNNSAIMGSVPKGRQGVAGALLAAARTVGFASGVAVAGLIYMTCLGSPQEKGSPEKIAHAVRAGMRVTAGIAVEAAVSSAVRGKTKKTEPLDSAFS